MAIYRHIHTTFWQDDFILDLSSEEKFFYLYLMTNSKTNQSGCYELTKRVIVFETGYTIEKASEMMKKFIDDKKIMYDNDTKEVLLINWSKYNWNTSPKVMACIRKEVEKVKSYAFYQLLNNVLISYGYGMETARVKPEICENSTFEEKLPVEERPVEKKKKSETKNKYGEYGRVLLKESQYNSFVETYGESKIKDHIASLDEYIQSNDNKNKYKDFNLVMKKSLRDDWFKNKSKAADKKPSGNVYADIIEEMD